MCVTLLFYQTANPMNHPFTVQKAWPLILNVHVQLTAINPMTFNSNTIGNNLDPAYNKRIKSIFHWKGQHEMVALKGKFMFRLSTVYHSFYIICMPVNTLDCRLLSGTSWLINSGLTSKATIWWSLTDYFSIGEIGEPYNTREMLISRPRCSWG